MKNNFFTIITPIYNQEIRVKRCIESIINQSYTLFEYILIDDGSKDKSYKVAKEYADKDERIRLFHQENKGSSEAYNYGLRRVRGDYFIILDNDDWLEHNTLQLLNEYIIKYNEPDVIQMGVQIHIEDSKDAVKTWVFCDTPLYMEKESRFHAYDKYKEKLINTNTRKAIKSKFAAIEYEGIGPYADEVVIGEIFEISDTLLIIPELLFHVNKLSTSDGSQHLAHHQLVEITLREIKMIEWVKKNSKNKPPYYSAFNSFEFFRASILGINDDKSYMKTAAKFFRRNRKYIMSFENGFKKSALFYYLVCFFPRTYIRFMKKTSVSHK